MSPRIPLLTLLLSTTLLAPIAFAKDTAPKEMAESNVADPMKYADRDMLDVLDAQKSLNPKPIETLTAAEARKQPSPADGVRKLMMKKGLDTAPSSKVVSKDITYSGAVGKLPARIYTPADADASKPLPVVVYYHGGGWVIADLDTYDAAPRALAEKVHAIVVSMEYRHAPEHKFPAAHDDAFAGYQWVLKNAASFGGDPKRIAVMGESAGGNLAINTAIAARDANIQMPVYQVLVYPVAGVDMNTPSYQANANAVPLNKAMMGWFVKNVIRSDKDKDDARINLVGKADLHDLPPATVITAQIDPLQSEGQALAEKLEDAGVKVNEKDYDGVTHEFFGMASVVSKAKDAQSRVSSDLKKAFSK